MSDNPRARKVADRIQEIVAVMIDRKLKDPRLGMVTVTDVRVTGDLQNATIFYTVLGDEEELRSSGAALESAKGMIRSEVGKQLGLRLTPTVEFMADALPTTARSIEDALIAARMRDSELARIRESAAPAGDPDPYKKPANDDE
ncbi:30S ribosome-binding factor RbfA [Flaviflexus huanghaiensis]|uniref:30S ribosome-binding factor RbfA n=1 Tax=Flaviflexus huanghaiensis TaxID=1111473 RepID=UPI0015FE398F|nr:30S ribosome-binding factor RbfA [Flaviflexus huanghaiensis]